MLICPERAVHFNDALGLFGVLLAANLVILIFAVQTEAARKYKNT